MVFVGFYPKRRSQGSEDPLGGEAFRPSGGLGPGLRVGLGAKVGALCCLGPWLLNCCLPERLSAGLRIICDIPSPSGKGLGGKIQPQVKGEGVLG